MAQEMFYKDYPPRCFIILKSLEQSTGLFMKQLFIPYEKYMNYDLVMANYSTCIASDT